MAIDIPKFDYHSMKQSILNIIITYFLFVVVFALQKPLFMLYHSDVFTSTSIMEYIDVIYNGLPLDFSMAGYLTIIPCLIIIALQWVKNRIILLRITKSYFFITSAIIAITLCLDLVLYGYWGFRLDMTPIFYFCTSPSAALASVPYFHIIIGNIVMFLIALALARLFNKLVTLRIFSTPLCVKNRIRNTIILSVITASLFIPIRGGFTVATMNLSAVYFSQQQTLNHAAINPLFSLMYSATHQNDFASQFRYFDADEATNIFKTLTQQNVNDSIVSITNTSRPDIYIIILESFSSHLLNSKCDNKAIIPCIDSIASQGILFTNFYASGIRTDRGIPAILSGYPALPDGSIMKYVNKTDKLPSIAKSLKNAGWETSYYYGGDANFTNMHAYLVSSGFSKIISDKDFPISERLSKWGAHDHLVFNRCINDIKSVPKDIPQFSVIQTSSSHEPFEVPYSRLSDNRANAFAYTDSCVGNFISKLKDLDKWNNALIVLVPDHYGAYPQNLSKQIDRHKIPLIIAGGAIKTPMKVETVGSQTDIAATLLAQCNVNHSEFTFSKDLFCDSAPHYAFISAPSVFGMINTSGYTIFNFESNSIIDSKGNSPDSILRDGKVFIQKLYDDINNR